MLIAVIGIAMGAFILNDFLSSSSRFFSGQETNVAVIDGKNVSQIEFARRLEIELDQRLPNGGANEQQQRSVRNLLWDQLVFENVFVPQAGELGIGITAEELFASLESDRPPGALRDYFSNPQTGQIIPDFAVPGTNKLNQQRVAQYLQNLRDNDQIASFLPIETAVRKELLENKYYNLISKAVYTTTNEAKVDQEERNKTVSFSYIVQKYNALEDDQVEYSESDLSAYWSKHNYLPEYQQDFQSRTIEYVVFTAIPTAEDSAAIRQILIDQVDKFTTADNDTSYVIANNSKRGTKGNIRWFTPADLNEDFGTGRDTLILNTDSGTVYGPYLDVATDQNTASTYNLLKVVDTKMSPDSANARQILIMYGTDSTAAKATADSLLLRWKVVLTL